MSLRLRLFLGLAGLVAVMVTAQWWWVGALTRDLSDEVGVVAFKVGQSMASIFTVERKSCPEGADCESEKRKAVFDFVVASPPPGHNPDVATVLPPLPEPHGEHRETWVGVQKGDRPPSWIKVPPDATSVHWVGKDGEEIRDTEGTTDVKVRRSFGYSSVSSSTVDSSDDGKPHEIVLSLDTESDRNKFFFSDDKAATQSGYITVLATDADVARRIPIPSEGVHDKLEEFRRRMLWGSLAIFAVGLMLSALVAQRVSAPLRRLALAAREVGEGSLGKQVPVSGSGEVSQAIRAFNHMSKELASYDRKTRELRTRQHLGEIGEISRGLAHTLRNPLNALGLSVEELAARAPEDDAALATSARRQIRRIDHSIRSFLALASQGGGVVSPVDPGELVQDVALEALQDGRRSHGGNGGSSVRVDVDVADGAPRLAAVEPELRAVLQALVVNAVEASPEGGTVAIRVRPDDSGERVRIEVEDEGPGLSAEVRERLFTPHLTTKANGSGMGLFLAHRIATTRYGGRLTLEDANKGTSGDDNAGTRAVLEIGPRSQELSDG